MPPLQRAEADWAFSEGKPASFEKERPKKRCATEYSYQRIRVASGKRMSERHNGRRSNTQADADISVTDELDAAEAALISDSSVSIMAIAERVDV
jgi:hypothetical protein